MANASNPVMVDSNVFVYAHDVSEPQKRAIAKQPKARHPGRRSDCQSVRGCGLVLSIQPLYSIPCAASHRSASIAAIQPEPAAVTACRYTRSATSPAANTPSTLV
ncbi:MAG: hypothetical protein KatS3mg022_1473 [Armatimonadota bacterium]|nr:MAG: hypothetical protein KatS3mg022_1473 [Armatimonadota bacterium]